MALEALPGVAGIVRQEPVPRHEDVRLQRRGSLQRAQPVAGVAVAGIRELVEVEHLAEVGDAVLGDEHDAVAAGVGPAEVENPDLLSAEVERDALAIGLVGEPGGPVLR